jgi:uncharacterized protein YdeI (YjbR/CyaY-like superfamily)
VTAGAATRRRPGSKWSQTNCQKAIDRIAEGKMRPAGLAEGEAAKRDGRWDAAYAPQRSIAVPADLQQKLDVSPRARRLEKFVAMLEDGKKIH